MTSAVDSTPDTRFFPRSVGRKRLHNEGREMIETRRNKTKTFEMHDIQISSCYVYGDSPLIRHMDGTIFVQRQALINSGKRCL